MATKTINRFALERMLNDSWGIPTSLAVNDNIVSLRYYQNEWNQKHFAAKRQPIYLRLIEWEENPIRLRDYHYWDLGHPNAYRIVCSPRFRELLKTLRLPEHRFYDAEIDVQGKKHHYFVLHFIHEWTHEIDYTQSQFKVVDLMQNNALVKTLQVGEVTSCEHYNQIIQLLGEAATDTAIHYLYPRKIHFLPTIQYDVWGLHGQIVLSPHAKEAIERAEITGVSMPPLTNNPLFTDLEVEMGE